MSNLQLILFSVLSADSILNTKLEALCADTSSSLGIFKFFLDMWDLPINKP